MVVDVGVAFFVVQHLCSFCPARHSRVVILKNSPKNIADRLIQSSYLHFPAYPPPFSTPMVRVPALLRTT